MSAPTSELHWLIFGAGAIGTYIGGSLALHGQNVAFLEQPGVAQNCVRAACA
jgi:ketopantoate reductase